MATKLTKARSRVLNELILRGGKASPYDLAYPRSNMMHEMFMLGWVGMEGRLGPWSMPASDGFWTITEAGRAVLSNRGGSDRAR